MFYNLKIEGIRENNLSLYLEGYNRKAFIGKLDIPHNTIDICMSKEKFIDKFGDIDIAFEVAFYYNETETVLDKNNNYFGEKATHEYFVNYEEDDEEEEDE